MVPEKDTPMLVARSMPVTMNREKGADSPMAMDRKRKQEGIMPAAIWEGAGTDGGNHGTRPWKSLTINAPFVKNIVIPRHRAVRRVKPFRGNRPKNGHPHEC